MFRSFATTALLLAAVTSAHAETVCNRCEIIDVDPFINSAAGTYVGAFWPHDRATFRNSSIVDSYGQLHWFSNFVVVDLNETMDVTITSAPLRGTQFGQWAPGAARWGILIYLDAGTVCFDDNQCWVRHAAAPALWNTQTDSALDGLTMAFESLPAGRYVLVFHGYTAALGESGYAGKITVKPPR